MGSTCMWFAYTIAGFGLMVMVFDYFDDKHIKLPLPVCFGALLFFGPVGWALLLMLGAAWVVDHHIDNKPWRGGQRL